MRSGGASLLLRIVQLQSYRKWRGAPPLGRPALLVRLCSCGFSAPAIPASQPASEPLCSAAHPIPPMHCAALLQVRTLLRYAAAEYDVYSRSHAFPVEAYRLLALNQRAFLSSLMTLHYSLQASGERDNAVGSVHVHFSWQGTRTGS